MFTYIFTNMESTITLNNVVIIFNAFSFLFPMIACFFSILLLTAGISVFLICNQFYTSSLHCCTSKSTHKMLQHILFLFFLFFKKKKYLLHQSPYSNVFLWGKQLNCKPITSFQTYIIFISSKHLYLTRKSKVLKQKMWKILLQL